MTTWQLRVLGEVCLEGEGKRLALERKTAALLTYLALEGQASRSRLAGLFWPDRPEDKARGNLRQCLHRLRADTAEQLVTGGDVLQLGAAVQADAARFKVLMFSGANREALALFGELLAPFDYDDLPDFADWLFAERETLLKLRREALSGEMSRLESQGDVQGALGLAAALVAQDPVSEEAQRQLMRLHYLSGDRAAALAAFARCRELLRRELGVEPLPETLRLADEIAAGGLLPKPVAGARRPIPLAIQRPPVLAGREEDWERLEEAWDAGQFIFIAGEAGLGKTRLAHDFAASKGPYLRFSGRPGDAAVPYAANARAWRQILAARPELGLEPWLRVELSRLLPELEQGEAPPPLASETDKLRFFDAQGELLLLGLRGLAAAIIDDLHFYDLASSEVAVYLTGKYAPFGRPGGLPRFIDCYRSFELAAEAAAYIERLVEAGTAALIELKPLDERAVAVLVDGFKLPTGAGLSEALSRFTGGNPLFIVETVKSLYEAGKLSADSPAQALAPLPPSGRVSNLIRQRLERLSPQAGRLLWSAAVAGEDFDLELAAHLLDTAPLELSASWRELETRHILAGDRFSHDLLYETALTTIPAPVKALLHRRCAGYLEAHEANPARIAQHYVEAGDEPRAVPWLLRAAKEAEKAFQFTQATEFYERAANGLEARGDKQGAFEALEACAELLGRFDVGARSQAVLDKLQNLSQTPETQARVWVKQAEFYLLAKRFTEVERLARMGCDYAVTAGHLLLQAEFQQLLGVALLGQGRITEAIEPHQTFVALSERLDHKEASVAALANLGLLFDQLGRHREAVSLHRRADQALQDWGEKLWARPLLLRNAAASQLALGLVQDALHTLAESDLLLTKFGGGGTAQPKVLLTMSCCWQHLNRYRHALGCLERVRELDSHGIELEPMHRCFAALFTELGNFREAEAHVEAALSQPNLTHQKRSDALLLRAKLLASRQEDPGDTLRELDQLLRTAEQPSLSCKLWILQAPQLEPEAGYALACKALTASKRLELAGLQIAAEVRCAQALLDLDRADEALRHVQSSMVLLEACHPVDFYLGEVLFTHYRVLAALDDPTAPDHLRTCVNWVLGVADRDVPLEYRRSFLEDNPVNKAILGAARLAGLDVPAAWPS